MSTQGTRRPGGIHPRPAPRPRLGRGGEEGGSRAGDWRGSGEPGGAPRTSQVGYVLVGGRSSRMGRDKALLPFRGAALAAVVAREVEIAAGSARLIGDPGRYGRLGFAVLPDAYPGEGPLGAILTALRAEPPEGTGHGGAEWNLIVACDMPGLGAGFLAQLLEAAQGTPADALLAGCAGHAEPLCGVYRRSALAALEAAFASGERSVLRALGGLAVAYLPAPDVTAVANVNTPEEWAAHGR